MNNRYLYKIKFLCDHERTLQYQSIVQPQELTKNDLDNKQIWFNKGNFEKNKGKNKILTNIENKCKKIMRKTVELFLESKTC